MPSPVTKPKVSRWIGTRAFQTKVLCDENKAVAHSASEGTASKEKDDKSLYDDRSLLSRGSIGGAIYPASAKYFGRIEPTIRAGCRRNNNVEIRQQTRETDHEVENGVVRGIMTPILARPLSKKEDTKQWMQRSWRNRPRSDTVPDITPVDIKPFKPSQMVLEKQGLVKISREPGSNYQGTRTSISCIRQIPNLPNEENCALWVTNLPPDMGLPAFLDIVRTGTVYAAVLSDPVDNKWTKAAKLVFKRRKAALEFFDQVQSNQGVVISGLRIKAVWNRNGYRENDSKRTRVLQLRGPIVLMTFAFWMGYFQECVVFELEAFRELPNPREGEKIVEFRFARVDGQAEALFRAIMCDERFADIVSVRYGPDPCDPESRLQ